MSMPSRVRVLKIFMVDHFSIALDQGFDRRGPRAGFDAHGTLVVAAGNSLMMYLVAQQWIGIDYSSRLIKHCI